MSSSVRALRAADRRLGYRLRTLRRGRGVSQAELGERLGRSAQQVQKYEAGTNRISATALQDVAEALSLPVASFFPENPHQVEETPMIAAALKALPNRLRLLPPAVQRLVLELVDALSPDGEA